MKTRGRSRGGDSRTGLSVKRGGVEKPKRPPNAFFVFMESYRKDYKEGHPHIKVLATVSRAGSRKWESLTDAEKAPHVAKAEKLRAEFTKKMDAYNKSQAPYVTKSKKLKAEHTKKAESKSDNDEEDDGGDSSLSAKKRKSEKSPNKPKRPLTAFFVFMEKFRKDYKVNYPNTKRECIFCKAGGEVWNSMTDVEKDPYFDKAKKLMAEYMEQMAVYMEKVRAYNSRKAGAPEASGDSDKSRQSEAGGPKAPGEEVAGGPEAPGDSDKSRQSEAGGPEAPGEEAEGAPEVPGEEAAGGLEAPGDSDKSRQSEAGGLKAPGEEAAGGPEPPGESDKSEAESDNEDDGSCLVRPLIPHPKEASVLVPASAGGGGNGGRPRRKHGAACRRLWRTVITGCIRVG